MAERVQAAVRRTGMAVLNGRAPDPQPDVVVVGLSDGTAAELPGVVRRGPGGPPVLLVLGLGVAARYDLVAQADDFIREPVNQEELLARLALLAERRGAEGEQLLTAGDISINLDRYEVRVSGVPISLTPKEYQLLCYLVRQAGRACTRQQLLGAVWSYDYLGGTRTVDIHVQRLRAKLGQAGAGIETVRGVGYRLRA
jgi:DNA-binding response OmpR family regulator